MTDLATLTAERDAARKKHIAQFAAPFEFDRFRKDLDALLRAERRLALAEVLAFLDKDERPPMTQQALASSRGELRAFLRSLENAE